MEYEDIHDYLGKEPDSLKSKMILSFQEANEAFPEKYSKQISASCKKK